MSFDEKIVGAEFLRNRYKNPIPYKNRACTMESSTNFCAIDGYYGYKHERLKELDTAVPLTYTILFFQTGLRDKLFDIAKRYMN